MLVLRTLGAAAIALGALYVSWRLTATVGPSGVGLTFWTAELVAYLSFVLTVLLMWNRRVRTGPLDSPGGSLDIFVPVCGEPADMVRRTIWAARAIAYPHRVWLLNDALIGGKDNWREIQELAEETDIRCLTRTDGSRGKAGNLNYGLRHSDGEFVGVIDADHVVDVDFAHETLGYFKDQDVAVVATPQQFVVEGKDVLNNLHPFFYEHLMPAKDAANAAFSCGNGAVYRRSALESIGGFSEWNLVEDLHTTYELHAAGYETVYHSRAVSMGTAPTTSAGLAKQHLTWAIDSLRILFFDSPLKKRGLTLRQRSHYFLTTTQYLTGIAQVAFWIAPLTYVLLSVSSVRGSEVGRTYLATAGPYYGAVFVWLAGYVGIRDTIRTAAQRTFLAPVFLVAALRALADQRAQSTVTEKVKVPRFSLLLLPTAFLMLLTVVTLGYGAAVASPDMTIGMLVSAATAFLLIGVSTAVTANNRAGRRLRFCLVGLMTLALVGFAIRAY